MDQNRQPVFTDNQIRAQLFTFLFAGFETTSVAIQAVLFHLGNEPQWIEKICQEFEVLKTILLLTPFSESIKSYQSKYVETYAYDNCFHQRINPTGLYCRAYHSKKNDCRCQTSKWGYYASGHTVVRRY